MRHQVGGNRRDLLIQRGASPSAPWAWGRLAPRGGFELPKAASARTERYPAAANPSRRPAGWIRGAPSVSQARPIAALLLRSGAPEDCGDGYSRAITAPALLLLHPPESESCTRLVEEFVVGDDSDVLNVLAAGFVLSRCSTRHGARSRSRAAGGGLGDRTERGTDHGSHDHRSNVRTLGPGRQLIATETRARERRSWPPRGAASFEATASSLARPTTLASTRLSRTCRPRR